MLIAGGKLVGFLVGSFAFPMLISTFNQPKPFNCRTPERQSWHGIERLFQ